MLVQFYQLGLFDRILGFLSHKELAKVSRTHRAVNEAAKRVALFVLGREPVTITFGKTESDEPPPKPREMTFLEKLHLFSSNNEKPFKLSRIDFMSDNWEIYGGCACAGGYVITRVRDHSSTVAFYPQFRKRSPPIALWRRGNTPLVNTHGAEGSLFCVNILQNVHLWRVDTENPQLISDEFSHNFPHLSGFDGLFFLDFNRRLDMLVATTLNCCLRVWDINTRQGFTFQENEKMIPSVFATGFITDTLFGAITSRNFRDLSLMIWDLSQFRSKGEVPPPRILSLNFQTEPYGRIFGWQGEIILATREGTRFCSIEPFKLRVHIPAKNKITASFFKVIDGRGLLFLGTQGKKLHIIDVQTRKRVGEVALRFEKSKNVKSIFVSEPKIFILGDNELLNCTMRELPLSKEEKKKS